MERGACAGHLPCHAACSAHTGEVNFSWSISGVGLVTWVIDIEYHAIIATIIMIINCPGAGWRLLQLGSARRHPCHSLQPLLHRVLPHPSSSFFVLSLTATPLKVWKIEFKRIFLNVDCPGYTPNLFHLDLAGEGIKLSYYNFTLITAFHQFPNKRRISGCLRLSGPSA